MMELSDFSAFTQIAITLNLAFVAIDGVKAYAKVLYNQVFKLSDFVNAHFNTLQLHDKKTVSSIRASYIDNNSTIKEVEGIKRQWEILTEKIAKKREEINTEIESIWDIKNLSSVSLWLFFYGVAFLGLSCIKNLSAVYWVWTILTLCSFVYLGIEWNIKDRKYASLKYVIAFFFMAILISAGGFLLPQSSFIINHSWAWNTICILSVIVQFSNFIVTILKVHKEVKQIKDKIEQICSNILPECVELNERVDFFVKVNKYGKMTFE